MVVEILSDNRYNKERICIRKKLSYVVKSFKSYKLIITQFIIIFITNNNVSFSANTSFILNKYLDQF